MNKIFLLLALVASGCALTVVHPDGSKTTYVPIQVTSFVRVTNSCTPYMDFERSIGVVKVLEYGQSDTIPLVSTPFSGPNRCMMLQAKGYKKLEDGKREYLGSAIATFCVDTYNGSREAFWDVTQISLPHGRGGCR